MFETLDDRMKQDAEETSTRRERLLKWVLIAVVSIALFGGLIWGVHFFSA
jgi:hypothetical protein